jgi:hypothetical protein
MKTIARSSRKIADRTLGRVLAVALLIVAAAGIAAAQDTTALLFKGGIGVQPITGVSATGTVNLNLVRGVSPAGPWRIGSLNAAVTPSGRIIAVGRGLLLAAGNGIGTNGGQKVHVTLFCGTAATATAHSSNAAGVALEPNGDFAIDDVLSPQPPVSCTNPVLLVRNAGGLWFAAGIQQLREQHDDQQ